MDQNIVEIINGLSKLQEDIRIEGVHKAQKDIRNYFRINGLLIEESLRIYDTIPESRRADLFREYREF